jgi:LacI family transcriptional regulator
MENRSRRESKSVTIKEVARKAGVSIATVSYVLAGTKKLTSKTIAKVHEAADNLGYVPNHLARGLKKRATPIIGILVPDIRNPFFPSIVEGVSRVLSEEGYEIFAASSDESEEKQQRILKSFLQYRFAGLIAIPTGDQTKIFSQFSEVLHQIPMVLLDRDIQHLKCAKVLLDNEAGAEELTSHLITSGHRKIGIIIPPRTLSLGGERFKGYKKALHEYGLELCQERVFQGNLFADSGEKALEYFWQLDSKIRPTAVISCSDVMTLGFLRGVSKNRMRIPDDISFVSFDDPDYFEFLNPSITCLSQPTEGFGREAAYLLTDALNTSHIIDTTIRLKGEIKIRKSVLINFQQKL